MLDITRILNLSPKERSEHLDNLSEDDLILLSQFVRDEIGLEERL